MLAGSSGTRRREDDSEVVYADLIREMVQEPARQNMVQGEACAGEGSRQVPRIPTGRCGKT